MDLQSKGPTAVNFISDKMETLQVPDNASPNCQYIKDGKLHFIEPKLRAENHHAVAEKIIFFRQYRAQTEGTAEMFQQTIEIPPAYMDLIAALVQDSDEPLTVLVARVNDTLSPFARSEKAAHKYDIAIEKAIRQTAQKCSYGLGQQVFDSIEHSMANIPWHLSISRWEVYDISSLPTDMQQIVTERRKHRQIMTEQVSAYIQNLPPSEKSTIVNTKHRNRSIYKEDKDDTARLKPVETEQEKEEKRLKREEEKKKREEKKQREEEKRLREEEKRKQREEEKRIRTEEKKKREEEKRKKEQSQLRLTSLFQKTTPTQDSSSPHHVEQKTIEPAKPTLFPAFYIKDHVHISNRCSAQSSPNISSYDQFKNATHNTSDVSIQNFLSQMTPDTKQKRGVSTHVDIRTLLLPGASDILQVPNVRMVLRMKLLQFKEDVRPAYYGTFTKQSRIVSGRRPFAQDVDQLDYDVDSEAEWEPEGEGEDIHSGDEDDDDPNTDMIDPEDAGWLVPEGYLSDNEGVEEGGERSGKPLYPQNASKRLAVRQVVLGPFFEGEDAAMEDEVMRPFETQFLVDVPAEGFNPFYKEPVSRSVNGNTTANATTTSTTGSHSPAAVTNTTNATNTTPTTNPPKLTDEQSIALISVINEKQSESIPSLINEAKANSVLKDVSKRSLAAQIKSIAVKEKRGTDTRLSWYVKDSATSLTPPPPQPQPQPQPPATQ
ncbi:uncharacterized protein ATC70_012795 [Mucor velutinosus]|uniref:Uncharacterized protein n=1 Tax=Mucor velutinosus TaxID=708070 RepID=A0AAN7HKQ5_9FUNG|nr:hypothetical protein ATC70_012795 [Mucor velutinosus]